MASAILSAVPDLRSAREIIKDRLYFLVVKKGVVPRNTSKQFFFCVDNVLLYQPFFGDFGPLNLGCTYRFCQMLKEKLENPKNEGKVIYFYCSSVPQQKSNAAVLIGAYQVIYMDRLPDEAYRPLEALEPFMAFRDAAPGTCTFPLTVKHCLRAFYKAMHYRFFDFSTFNVEEYEHFETVENGDLNILIPNKFLAFAGPQSSRVGPDGLPAHTPDDYVPIFQKYGVSTVIRLNKKCYDRKRFTDSGFSHYDLYFVDGTTPSASILERFIQICETHKGTIAVHCKAGLGRTGTTIGCYIMKHWRLTAAETIAWLRICRPGCIIGPQQHFLRQHQARLWKEGRKFKMSAEEEAWIRPNGGAPIMDDGSLSSTPTSRTNSLSGMVKESLHIREERKEDDNSETTSGEKDKERGSLQPGSTTANASANAPLPQASPHSATFTGAAVASSSSSSATRSMPGSALSTGSAVPPRSYGHFASPISPHGHVHNFPLPHSPPSPLQQSILYAGGVHLDKRITYPSRPSYSSALSNPELTLRSHGTSARVYTRETKEAKDSRWRPLPASIAPPGQRILRSAASRETKTAGPNVETRAAARAKKNAIQATVTYSSVARVSSVPTGGTSRQLMQNAPPLTRQQQLKLARLSKEQ